MKLRDNLSPEWLRDVICLEYNGHTLVISPKACYEKGINNIKITRSKFSCHTILTYRLKEIFGPLKPKDKQKF